MTKIRVWGPVIATVVVVVAVTVIVSWRPWERTSGDADAATRAVGFTRHAGAVQTASTEPNFLTPDAGLFGLFPYRDCLLGLGGVETRSGTAPAFWTDPSGGCDHLTIGRDRAEQADTAGSHATDVTPRAGTVLADGTLVTVTTERDQNDYSSSSGVLSSRDADGNLHDLAELDAPENAGAEFMQRRGHVNFYGVAAGADGTLFVGGSQSNPATQNDGEPRLWRYANGGNALTPVDLPDAAAYSGTLDIVAADGPMMIAAGSGNLRGRRGQNLLAWTSVDSGQTWTKAAGNQPQIMFPSAALHTGDGWLIAGSTDQYQAPIVLRSTDGQRWTVTTLPDAINGLPGTTGGGNVIGLAVDRGTGTIYAAGWIGKGVSSNVHDPHTCGAVWTSTTDARTWRGANLGCDIAIPVAETTMANGAVVIASNSDLWVHQPA